jgi:hypothetical protein
MNKHRNNMNQKIKKIPAKVKFQESLLKSQSSITTSEQNEQQVTSQNVKVNYINSL